MRLGRQIRAISGTSPPAAAWSDASSGEIRNIGKPRLHVFGRASGPSPRALRLDRGFLQGAFLPKFGTFRAYNAGGRAVFKGERLCAVGTSLDDRAH